jgi:four helix bundle protein
MAQDYHDLIVWKKAIALTICIYKLTQAFPRSELYGLTSQMRRASISVASNIAEGRGRLNAAEFRQFLGIAQGSIFELRTQLLVAKSLEFATFDSFHDADTLSNEVSKILRTFIERLSSETIKNKTAPAISMRRTITLKARS